MITIQATGDTTLHTAGKYCEEDILVKVPSSSGGVSLPQLSNEGSPEDLVEGKELINSSGNIVVGTNPYEKVATDSEVQHQADLLSQAIEALKEKAVPEENLEELPELTNEGVADDLVLGKELIDSNGKVVTGTNPYEKASTDETLNLQADLLSQAVLGLEGKIGHGLLETCSITNIHTRSSKDCTIVYPDKNFQLQSITLKGNESVNDVIKNSIILYIGPHEEGSTIKGTYEVLGDYQDDNIPDANKDQKRVLFVKSDLQID